MKTRTASKIDPRALVLTEHERRRLLLFVAVHRVWARRYCLPLETIVERYLQESGFRVRLIEKIQYHPVWRLVLAPASNSCPRSKVGVAATVSAAFRFAGFPTPKDSTNAFVSGQSISAVIHLPTWPKSQL